MIISPYVEFKLVEKVSSKTNQPYYAIVMVLGDYEFNLCFLTKDRYDLVKLSLDSKN